MVLDSGPDTLRFVFVGATGVLGMVASETDSRQFGWWAGQTKRFNPRRSGFQGDFGDFYTVDTLVSSSEPDPTQQT